MTEDERERLKMAAVSCGLQYSGRGAPMMGVAVVHVDSKTGEYVYSDNPCHTEDVACMKRTLESKPEPVTAKEG